MKKPCLSEKGQIITGAPAVTLDQPPVPQTGKSLARMGLAALGVVFGDIGTSPLYTLKTVLDVTGGASRQHVLGVLSLLIWTLIIVTSVKYVSFAMRIDNDGEGGILALMSLLGIKRKQRPLIVAVGLFGAALIYGDGAITPAISVLSALEGVQIVAPDLHTFILPLTMAILIALFAVQPLGTAKIGRAFGPIMLLWFGAIALLGLAALARHPAVLVALSPTYAASFLIHGGWISFLVLGAVFLCVTGAEALYADMGHFGAGPIRIAWYAVVFPSLILNYAGQAALVAAGGSTEGNIFYQLCPHPLLMPFIVLATLATIIASQSIITGAFSMTRQAINLGWLPRLKITQTSKDGFGQIYVGAVNWILMAATIGLALAFKKSDNLASAYGIAVSATMLMTTVLLFIAMREIWQWSLAAAGAVAGCFFIVDASFFLANMTKLAEGGYVPLALAALVYGVMYIWHRGKTALNIRIAAAATPLPDFFADLQKSNVARVPGTAVFLTRTQTATPPIIAWHVRTNRVLREQVIAVTVLIESKPYVGLADRVTIEEAGQNFWRVIGHYGFMQRPNLPGLARAAQEKDPRIDLSDVIYYVGTETVVPSQDRKTALPRWQEALFAAMDRNEAHIGDFMQLPPEQVVELGRQIPI
jgi:KUP system potassium uptake protein